MRRSAAEEVCNRHSLLAFELDLQQLQLRAQSRGHKESISFDDQFSRRRGSGPGRKQTMHRQLLTAEECVGSRPGLETAPAVVDLGGRPGEINQRVLALENPRQRG